jgi:hypothetical protein
MTIPPRCWVQRSVRLFRFFLELDDIVGSKYNIHSVEEQGHIVVMLLHWVQEVGSFPHCDLSKISLFIKKLLEIVEMCRYGMLIL